VGGGVTKIVEKDGVWECYSEVGREGGSVVEAEKEVFPLVVEGGGGGGGHCGGGGRGGEGVAGVGWQGWGGGGVTVSVVVGHGILLALFLGIRGNDICPWFGFAEF